MFLKIDYEVTLKDGSTHKFVAHQPAEVELKPACWCCGYAKIELTVPEGGRKVLVGEITEDEMRGLEAACGESYEDHDQ
tara:strand:- start:8685 stop:8921 length:237 start_codon:yes stop_codon:yes gene_type:complete